MNVETGGVGPIWVHSQIFGTRIRWHFEDTFQAATVVSICILLL